VDQEITTWCRRTGNHPSSSRSGCRQGAEQVGAAGWRVHDACCDLAERFCASQLPPAGPGETDHAGRPIPSLNLSGQHVSDSRWVERQIEGGAAPRYSAEIRRRQAVQPGNCRQRLQAKAAPEQQRGLIRPKKIEIQPDQKASQAGLVQQLGEIGGATATVAHEEIEARSAYGPAETLIEKEAAEFVAGIKSVKAFAAEMSRRIDLARGGISQEGTN
jgi:hypothetical protein